MDYGFFLDSILKHLDEGIIIVDTNANITYFNEPATNIAGITYENAIGKNILDVFPDLTAETSTFYSVLKNKKSIIDYVQQYKNFKGNSVTTLTSTLPLIKNEEILGALEIYRPIDKVLDLSEKVRSLQKELYKKNIMKEEYRGNGTIYSLESIIGECEAIKLLKNKAKKIADSTSPVLVYGETGTGKELLVQGIHNHSTRKNKPFIAQNCAAIPRTLLEGILFGTSAGSFTGAKDSPGIFELADGGTLFLDEINSMDIDLQAKLLRVLQDGIIRRVGGKKTISVDVRIIASTNELPLQAVEKKILRQDLYYRLNAISFNIPPLRERKEDIPKLINNFIDKYNVKLNKKVQGISQDAVNTFLSYDWPGNIRQLKHVIESIMNFMEGSTIKVEDLPEYIMEGKLFEIENCSMDQPYQNSKKRHMPLKDVISEYEKKLIEDSIQVANGNCAEAARILSIPKQTLHNKIKKYNINWNCNIIK